MSLAKVIEVIAEGKTIEGAIDAACQITVIMAVSYYLICLI